MSVISLCNLQVSLWRGTTVQGQSGGQAPTTFTEDSSAIDIPCSVQPANAATMLRYAQRQAIVTSTLYFDFDYAPTVGIDQWRSDGGRIFKIKGWYNSLELDDAWVCDCEETRLPGRVTG